MLNNDHESMFVGSLMLFSTEGTLHQHFPDDIIQEEEDTEPVPLLFTLSSDTIGVNKEEGQKRMVGALDTEDSESKGLYDYTYDGPQLFLNSDKITINSRQQSMFLSSFQNIIISSGIKLEFVSENETIFEASNIYLGRQSRDKKVSGESPAEPLVLGEQLRLFLTEMVEILETAHGLCQGAPIPVMDSSGAPLLPKWLQLKQKIADVDTAPFNSQYHFIEDNGNKT
jgi:hypothetical protein